MSNSGVDNAQVLHNFSTADVLGIPNGKALEMKEARQPLAPAPKIQENKQDRKWAFFPFKKKQPQADGDAPSSQRMIELVI